MIDQLIENSRSLTSIKKVPKAFNKLIRRAFQRNILKNSFNGKLKFFKMSNSEVLKFFFSSPVHVSFFALNKNYFVHFEGMHFSLFP